MGFSCGIVGLPNVGKSTLFNALMARAAAETADYPFCTIEPHVGRVAVPDARLRRLAALAKAAKVIAAQTAFTDIAGLVRGASRGEGLGNRFLAHIREVDAVAHVVRCFKGATTHVEGAPDPLRDIAVVETELALADLESLQRRSKGLSRNARLAGSDASAMLALADKLAGALDEGRPVRGLGLGEEERARIAEFQLLTAKPMLYVANVGEDETQSGNALSREVEAYGRAHSSPVVVVAAQGEEALAELKEDERAAMRDALKMEESGLERMIRGGYRLLGLHTFFTAGEKEARAWTIPCGATALEAAGCIHGDFARGFICAETIGYEDYVACGSEVQARRAGKLRQEGKGYVVRDGDVVHFRFNV